MGRFLTPGWLLRHVLAVVVTVGCLGMGYWQWTRATEGSSISWGYAFEWPLFAVFAIALWIREVRTELARGRGESVESTEPPLVSPFDRDEPVEPAASETGDDATDAYNRYLAWLAADPNRRPGEYPG
ncbi:hypothetical protein LX16_0961 [Stackebrandtia albiflava]|uniref:DNA-binding transcriptional regulator of glucitol operon n=1 Tax=Stackebrandtia albiflava TaxID=406432 RepID=A0A562VBS0_9ACTN|nr:hypothetical protein [Stackebrandtia albiflava]TWJ15261.1 hypothetical protein LX16_0961 [Stackebrandtia albiflava]